MAGSVVVGCKMPNGLHLDLVTITRDNEGRVIGQPERERFATLKGCAPKHGQAPITVGGAAFTQGIDADKWAQWLVENKGSALLCDGLVFEEKTLARAQAHAKEEMDRPAQFAPLGGEELKKGRGRGIKGITPDDTPLSERAA